MLSFSFPFALKDGLSSYASAILTLVPIFLTISSDIWKYTNLKLFYNSNCVLQGTLLSRKPPLQGKVKINFNNALFWSSDHTVIFRDDKGDVLLAWSWKKYGVFKVDDIEALAALRGLQIILHLGVSNLILKGIHLLLKLLVLSNLNFQGNGLWLQKFKVSFTG